MICDYIHNVNNRNVKIDDFYLISYHGKSRYTLCFQKGCLFLNIVFILKIKLINKLVFLILKNI